MVVPFPTFIALALCTLGLLTLLIRRWEQASALTGGLGCGALAMVTWFATSRDVLISLTPVPIVVDWAGSLDGLGFVLQLQQNNLALVILVLSLAGVTLLLAGLAAQGPYFAPLSLLIVGGYVELLMLVAGPLEPLLLMPLALTILAALGVFVLQADQVGKVTGPLRSLLPPVLAFPLFLLVGWYVEQIQLNPQAEGLHSAAGWLLAIGLLILLAPVPLHSGRPTTAQTAPPYGTILLVLLYQLAVLFLLYRTLTEYPFVAEQISLNLWLTAGGVLTAVWGGVASAGTAHPGRLWGYALLHDWGLILLILATPGGDSWPLVLSLFGLRAVSALTAAVGLAQLRHHAGSLQPEWLQGAGSRMPWSSTAFLLGSLGLAGFPLSAGFAGHWEVLQTVAVNDWRIAAAVLVASGGVVFGFVRLVRILFDPFQVRLLSREKPGSAIAAAASILLSTSVAIAPQLMGGPVGWILTAFGG